MKLAVAPISFAACLLGSLCAFGAHGIAIGDASGDHPVGKVIKLIEGLQAEVKEEGRTEALANEKFVYWCKTSMKTISESIASGKQETAKLTSKINAGKQQEAALEGETKELQDNLDELDAQSRMVDEKRAKTAALYNETSNDLKATIQAMDAAIKAIKDSKPSLLNVDSSAVTVLLQTPEVHRAVSRLQASVDDVSPRNSELAEFLEVAARPVLKASGDHANHVQPYNFKSGNVIELLSSLKLNFEDELVHHTTAETDSMNEYELAKQARDDMISAAEAAKGEKEGTLNSVQGDITQWESDMKSASGDLDADEKTEADTENKCTTRAREWEQRCAVRNEELEAMATAISILDKAGGVRTEAPTNPIPPAAPAEASDAASFLQIVSPREKALNLLRTTAHATHSKAMERLIAQLASRPNSPFDRVNNMIQKMIFRLMDEQTEEDKRKTWCDQEISKTNRSAVDKTDKVGELSGKIDLAKARVQKLTGDIVAANKIVSELTAFMKEAVEVRAIGKKENAAAVKDAQDAQTAIVDATAVLKDFYKKSGMIEKEPYEFVQRSVAPVDLEDPEPPLPEYKGTPKATDIISLLDKTASEFARMEADTRAQESTDEEDFQAEMSTSKIDKVRRTKESETKGLEKKNLVDEVAMLEKSRKNVQKELDMTMQYIKDLRPACVEGSSSYADRKAARQQEADALRQAQGILADAYKEKATGNFLEVRHHIAAEQ